MIKEQPEKQEKQEDKEKQQFVVAGKQWMLDVGHVENELIFADILLQSQLCDKRIKKASMDLDRKNGVMTINIHLSRFWMFFINKNKIIDKIYGMIFPMMEYYEIFIKFVVNKKVKKKQYG